MRSEALIDTATAAGRAYGLPLMLIADWNMTPSELASAAWLVRQRMRLVIPVRSEVSCDSGNGPGPCGIIWQLRKASRTLFLLAVLGKRYHEGPT